MKILNIVGARPNFMKVAPIHREMGQRPELVPVLVHTGQHYDEKMSKIFFEDLQMPFPDIYLGVGSGTHAEQTAKVMVEFEKICLGERPDLVLVVGDVNSTLACSIVASKLHIKVAHVEAGLRSWDRAMPEEINRLVTDQISDFLFTHSPEALVNLRREGVHEGKIHFVGNVMIDSLAFHLDRAVEIYERDLSREYPPGQFGLITLHRPSNVDDERGLQGLLEVLNELSRKVPLHFPVHPRTAAKIKAAGFSSGGQLHFSEPIGYLSFLGLMKHARIVITDSGGIQEETSYLDIPCVTARDNTERPITVELGTNILAGTSPENVYAASLRQLESPKRSQAIPLWDGQAAKRIVDVLNKSAVDGG